MSFVDKENARQPKGLIDFAATYANSTKPPLGVTVKQVTHNGAPHLEIAHIEPNARVVFGLFAGAGNRPTQTVVICDTNGNAVASGHRRLNAAGEVTTTDAETIQKITPPANLSETLEATIRSNATVRAGTSAYFEKLLTAFDRQAAGKGAAAKDTGAQR
jgi:hypothetical protein